MNIVWQNKTENMAKLCDVLSKLVDESLDMVLLPEMSLTGFSMNTDMIAEADGQTVEFAKKMSQKYKVALGIGWAKKGELSENHYTIVNNNQILLDYVKMHPFSYAGEDKFYKSGDSISNCQIFNFKVGVAICYDLRFPEVFQAISKNSDIIIVPANWPDKRSDAWKTLLRARAIENQCYIAGVNCAGQIDKLFYSGDSAIYNPEGEQLQCKCIEGLTNPSDRLLIFDIENDVDTFRKNFPTRKDRRPDLYKTLY